ncbi:hypothetical protein ACE5IS_09475 [Leptospira wolffii]|uniref:SH3 domain-containing protein n=1 Tax=Leptospira wolffii TaxID=409998 RepID=A0ABV5BP02_9LEPT|nr:SH3 domain-containing protein [Leptospira wolffii]TGL52610.1 SH3 domain-containing protein [Leptospira wolffii]
MNVRIRPDRQSEKLGFLPYGTKILVEKAQTFEVQNRSKIYWFYFPEMQGYIFGDYLSDSPPPKGKKKASLYLYSGDNCGYYQNETLTLQDGIARLEIDWEEEGGFCSKGLLEGIVSFRNGRMSISQWKGDRLKDHCSSASETDPKLTEDDLKKRLMFYAGIEEDLELYYDPLLDGYATEKIIQMYKSGKWKIDKKSCSIRQDYECKYSDKNTTQSLGYFCFRNSRT